MNSSYIYNLGLAYRSAAASHGDVLALIFEDGVRVTHAELEALSNRIARRLIALGIGRGDVVVIAREKDRASYALLIACLKLGAPYVMLDLLSPPARQERILRTCRPRLIVADTMLSDGLAGACASLASKTIVESDEEFVSRSREFVDEPLDETDAITGEDTAYVMFTSGSTGAPKGAAMSHANALNFTAWSAATFSITRGSILSGINPLYFDNSVFDTYASLLNGASLAPFRRETVQDPARLVQALEAAQCSIWFSVPSLLVYLITMKVLSVSRLTSLKWIIFGGEGFPKSELVKLWALYRQRARFVNVYGPTECTCICSAYDISERDFADLKGLPPLGRLAPNFEGLLIDESDRPVPAGEAGELCLLGPCVGKGYFNEPERTAAVFVPAPTRTATRRLMYRTGDLVRCDPDTGLLWFVGRKDNQIKHLGYRIELEEVESAANSLPYVVQCAAIYRRASRGTGRIVVAISLSEHRAEDAIQADLRALLPPYMLPSEIHAFDHLPKNANGKVDRLKVSELVAAANAGISPSSSSLPRAP